MDEETTTIHADDVRKDSAKRLASHAAAGAGLVSPTALAAARSRLESCDQPCECRGCVMARELLRIAAGAASRDAAVAKLKAALKNFVDYYDQSGIGPCEEGNDDVDTCEGDRAFNGDERFNVRRARLALAAARTPGEGGR